ncbi:GLE1-like protein [Cryptosporidium felis]|nr:GLE1-like protein [Cryptosporidium felis]
MDGDKLSQDLNCMLFSWESKYDWRRVKVEDLPVPGPESVFLQTPGEAEEDAVSLFIAKHIREIEEEIQKVERERARKRAQEEEERERRRREQEETERLQKEREREAAERLKKEQEQKEQEQREQKEREKEQEQKERQRRESPGLLSGGGKQGEKQAFESEARTFVEKTTSYQNSEAYREIASGTEASVKSTRMMIKKTIQLSVNQISSTHQQVASSSNRIIELLSMLHPNLGLSGLRLELRILVHPHNGRESRPPALPGGNHPQGVHRPAFRGLRGPAQEGRRERGELWKEGELLGNSSPPFRVRGPGSRPNRLPLFPSPVQKPVQEDSRLHSQVQTAPALPADREQPFSD